MGRHRRSAAVPVADDYADGPAGSHRGDGRRKPRRVPIRTGLLGVSAAMAVGAVAVTSGLLPGGETFNIGGGSDSGGQVRTDGPPELVTQGEASAEPTESVAAPTSPSARTPQTPQAPPKKTASPTPVKPAKPSVEPSEQTKAPQAQEKKPSTIPPRTEPPAADRSQERPAPSGSTGSSSAAAAEAAVLSLVNEERAKVGCSPVRADAALADLAGNFSADMAARDFFDHTNPDGLTPWDRAAQAGVESLGGENIARGQADAAAVMTSWMNSDGHRANILNCDYKTLGVGVHLGAGGPWWTQNFGF
ncbi:CAP domain-containing protein [Streptomyces sp. NPDC052236]|uniref:CAP domain-containing protein n=1 Tax=Streptomyces sp. NPDC052236 TaxID=3365686 RepID=UPI0037D90D1E